MWAQTSAAGDGAGEQAAPATPPASSTSPTSGDQNPDEEAQRLADQAVAAYEKADYPAAVKLFKQAHALRADPTLLYNLAKTYEKMDHPDLALEYYRRYLVADSTDPKLRGRAESRVKLLSAGQQGPVATGSGEQPKPVAPPTSSSRGGKLLWSGVAVAAVGVVGLAVGIGLDAASASQYNTFQGTEDEMTKRAARNSAQSLSSGALAGYVVGGVLLAGGGALIGLGLKKRLSPGHSPDHVMDHGLQATLVPMPGGGAAMLAGWF